MHSRSQRRRRVFLRAGRLRLHIYTFTDFSSPLRTETVALLRSRFEPMVSFGNAADLARTRLPGVMLTDIRSVPAPRRTSRLDTICRKHTLFQSFVALLPAAGSYRPSIRLDLTGGEGRDLARAYDACQARWGDPRRVLVWQS